MTDPVRSAARVLDLIELLSSEPAGLHLSAAAERLSLPKSSTLMLLRTLVARKYLRRTEADRYVLSPDYHSGAFGWRAAPFAQLTAAAEPTLHALVAALEESATFGVPGDVGEARVLAKVVAPVEVRWDSDISRPIPVYCTAIGRALLSGMAPDERIRQLAALPLRQVTACTVTDPDRILAIVEEAAQRGYVIAAEEAALGGTGVAAPVFDQRGVVIGAVNVSCVTSRVPEKRAAIIDAVVDAAAEIGRRALGCRSALAAVA